MGNIASPWRYDSSAHCALRSSNLRKPAISLFALWPNRWQLHLNNPMPSIVSQGDGELSGTAIEASLNVLFQVIVRKDFAFPSPLLETPECWIVHGFDPDLNIAMRAASLDMLHLLTEHRRLSRADAYSLVSVAADFAVRQVVDTRLGVHVRIPKGVFAPTPA
jgi:acetamidase/formamidase